MKLYRFGKLSNLPLQLVLVVPFVLQVLAAVGLVGYLSFRNGEKAISTLAGKLMERTNNEVLRVNKILKYLIFVVSFP